MPDRQEQFLAQLLARIARHGGLLDWEGNGYNLGGVCWPGTTLQITPWEQSGIETLRKRGDLETDYGPDGELRLRLPQSHEESKNDGPKLPYDETPAIRALRARKLALGR